ncbi:hypothetical protein [Paraburkholderia fungorum]
MSILGHHYIGGRRSVCVSNNPLFSLDAVTGEPVRAAQIEESAS